MHMVSITTVTFFKFNSHKFWAFKQMGLMPMHLSKVKGLLFFKLMGTGGGNGFSLWPDFSTYALLGVWNSEKEANDFYSKSTMIKKYMKKVNVFRTIKLNPIHSHGLWSGQNPFQLKKKIKPNIDPTAPVAVITRATLKWNRLLPFWKSVPVASAAIENAKGVSFFKGIGEWPFVQQATLSLWENTEAVKNFAYKGKAHAEIIKKTKSQGWYSEDLFARFHLISDTGFKKTEDIK